MQIKRKLSLLLTFIMIINTCVFADSGSQTAGGNGNGTDVVATPSAIDIVPSGISIDMSLSNSEDIDDMIVGTNYTLEENENVDNLTLNGGTLDLNGYTLTVYGSLQQNGGTLQINGGNLIIINDYSIGNTNHSPDAYLNMTNANDYVFVGSYPYGSDLYGTWLYLVNRKTKETREIGFSGNKYPQFILDVQEVNGQFYALVPNAMGEDIPNGINIYKINLDSYSSHYESYISYDMTENTYVRGNRIYFMCSRDTADITYTYYDTEKKEQGPITRISAEQIIESYLNK